jgi:LPXTG-motif cell wall-anchored protein
VSNSRAHLFFRPGFLGGLLVLKLKLAGAAAAAVLVGLVTISGAQAAYEDPPISVNISDSTPTEGTTFTVTASSTADCAWTASFNGSVEEDNGNALSATFTSPQVSKRTEFPLVVRCRYDDTAPVSAPVDTTSNRVTPAAIQTATRTVTITVLPTGDDGTADDSGALPDTGGSSAKLLWAGGALVIGGVAVTIAARRRGNRA